jgi:hypothetical protein
LNESQFKQIMQEVLQEKLVDISADNQMLVSLQIQTKIKQLAM